MTSLLLTAFFDKINYTVGPILAWIFALLLTIEVIYVMVKYLGSSNK